MSGYRITDRKPSVMAELTALDGPRSHIVADKVRRLEAEHTTLQREYLDAQREGELLSLTRTLAHAHGLSIIQLRQWLCAEIERLSLKGQ